MGNHADVAVIGAGIVGLAHAWAAAQRGQKVLLFERSAHAQGASIRNFGMIWPIGQIARFYPTALRSRELWLELAAQSGIWHNPCGSLHLAHRADEWQVLSEFAEIGPVAGYQCELWSPDKVLRHCPAANRNDLRGGLWSATELCVSPRQAIAAMPQWLTDRFQVESHFNTPIVRVDLPIIEAADGRQWQVDRAVVCSGVDFQTLFPQEFLQALSEPTALWSCVGFRARRQRPARRSFASNVAQSAAAICIRSPVHARKPRHPSWDTKRSALWMPLARLRSAISTAVHWPQATASPGLRLYPAEVATAAVAGCHKNAASWRSTDMNWPKAALP